jgi:NAD(P)-dependent dehydrogenase (short-subunit alcohol dehydrogenase family)
MTNSSHSLSGKKVIILGGSSGIGLATAIAAASEGAKVVIVSSNRERLDQALKSLPKDAQAYSVDLSKEENIKDLFGKIGRLDHLVYTAAENISLGSIAETDIASAREFFTLRFWGAFAAAKYAAPLINEGGSINLTSGIAGIRPGKNWSVAASLCMAMEGLVRALAVELAPIRVNCVTPGVVKTNLWNSMPEADRNNLYKTIGDSLPVKHLGEAEDIALAFTYLMKQPYMTGQHIIIDGGSVLV